MNRILTEDDIGKDLISCSPWIWSSICISDPSAVSICSCSAVVDTIFEVDSAIVDATPSSLSWSVVGVAAI